MMHSSRTAGFGQCLVCFLMALLICSCGGKSPGDGTAGKAAVKVGPKVDTEKFAVLKKASTNSDLPFLIGENVDSDLSCFKKGEGIEPQEANLGIKEEISDHPRSVQKAIVNWIFKTLEPTQLNEVFASKWSVKVDDVVVSEMTPDLVRFDKDPACLTDSGWLPEEQNLVTTLIGVKTISFTATVPLDADGKESLVDAASAQNVKIESDALFEYEIAKKSNGDPIKDSEGNEMYTSPSGVPIAVKDIPPESSRMMSEWTFKLEQPLYIAYRTFAKKYWRLEMEKDACNVVLIPGDKNVVKPDCAQFQELGFSLDLGKDGDSPVIKLAVEGGKKQDTLSVEMAWDDVKRVVVNDRIIVWMMVQKVEVGVQIWLNSLTLDPSPLGDVDTSSGYESAIASNEEKDAAKDDEKAKKEKAKKRLKNSDNALDQYLSN